MVTTDIFEKLKTLQGILVEKYDVEAKEKDAPKQLDSQKELLARLKKEYITKNAQYEEIKEKVLKLKLELEEAIKSRESGEKGMDNITTHREYEALEKQISEATDKENDVRKELQKEEKFLEELKETLKSDEEMIKSQEDELASGEKALEKQKNDFKKKLDKLNNEENKITPDLNQEILFKFQRIIQRNSEGIVAVKNGVCTGCHMILPAQFANIVREGENIMFCPYCSRILFYEEAEAGDAETYFSIENAGSLTDLDDDDDDEYYEDSEEDEERTELGYEDEDSDSIDETDEDEDLDDEDEEMEDEESSDEE